MDDTSCFQARRVGVDGTAARQGAGTSLPGVMFKDKGGDFESAE